MGEAGFVPLFIIQSFIEKSQQPSSGVYLMKLIGLCGTVIIAMILLPFVDSLVFRTAYYSESHTQQFFEIHKDFKLIGHGHVIQTLILDEFECGLQCVRSKICQSYNFHSGGHHGNRTCQLNDQTRHSKPTDLRPMKGFTYYGKERLGFHSSNPGRSCKDIWVSEIPMKSGEYWIDPDNNGNPFKVYCDMLYGGGWLLIANFEIEDSGHLPTGWKTEPAYRGISNYNNKRMGISRNAMKELRTRLNFTQLRFQCRKQHGRTIHIKTVENNTGEAVVQYFSGQTDVIPTSCGSFVRMKDDNSRLAKQCERWGYSVSTNQLYTGNWNGIVSGNNIMYNHALFVGGESHWIVGSSAGRWECDDNYNEAVSPKDFWRIYVR